MFKLKIRYDDESMFYERLASDAMHAEALSQEELKGRAELVIIYRVHADGEHEEVRRFSKSQRSS